MNSTDHPDKQDLDAYCAGYYQEQPQRAQEIASHLEQCSYCADSLQFWTGLEQALSHQEQRIQPWLATQLAQRRMDATEIPSRRGLRLLPVAAPVMVAVFAALFVWRNWLPTQSVPGVAPVVQSVVIQYDSPRDEMYANMDLYLWLVTRIEGADASTILRNPPG